MAKLDKPVYFISDLHLGSISNEKPHERERRVVRWLDSVKDKAGEIYLMGDILDYWYEYRYVVPRGFVRFFGKIAELSDAGVKIHWFIGNHDIWIFDYLPTELGIEVVDGEIVRDIASKRFFLAHGDSVGKRSPMFRFIRALFRNRFCQFLFSGIHPRWTVPFAFHWSHESRSNHKKTSPKPQTIEDSLITFSQEHSSQHPEIDYYVFGHLHSVKTIPLQSGATLIELGDWIHYNSFGMFDGENFKMDYFKG